MSALRKPRRVLFFTGVSQREQMEQLLLCALFVTGIVLGYLASGLVREPQHLELAEYLSAYATAKPSIPVGNVLFAYYRDAVLLLALGFLACGVWLIPLSLAGQGFFLAFAVRCFAAALGRKGVLFAFAAFGIRCLFVLPCSFFLAQLGWRSAMAVRKGGRARERTPPPGDALYGIAVCLVVLLIGAVIEISLVPRLLAQILS